MAKVKKVKKTPKGDGAPVELAEKKKHVRELAKAAQWKEVVNVCGFDLLSLLADVEKNKAKHTPRSLAQEILAKNGYELPSPPKETREKEVTEVAAPKTPVMAVPEAVVPKTPMVVAPVMIEDSPDTITEAQRQQIESRRQQALERRKQKMAMLSAQNSSHSINHEYGIHHSVIGSAVQEYCPLCKSQQRAETLQYQGVVRTEQKQQQHNAVSRGNAAQQAPDRFLEHHASNQKHHSLFLDDLEAAVDIINWEENQQVGQACAHEVSPEEYAVVDHVAQWEAQQAERSTSFDHYNTILDELDAAADIVQWETEQANASAMGRSHFSISDELAAAEIVDWEIGHQNVGGGNREWCVEASAKHSKFGANLLHGTPTGDAESTGNSEFQRAVGKTNGSRCSEAPTDRTKFHGTSASVPESTALIEAERFIS
ncbi:hypothetical protein FI667_g7950, partial [Globisporangium splendens]